MGGFFQEDLREQEDSKKRESIEGEHGHGIGAGIFHACTPERAQKGCQKLARFPRDNPDVFWSLWPLTKGSMSDGDV
jgi:hypothetical protein